MTPSLPKWAHQRDFNLHFDMNREELEALLAQIYAEIDKDAHPILLEQAKQVADTIRKKFQRSLF